MSEGWSGSRAAILTETVTATAPSGNSLSAVSAAPDDFTHRPPRRAGCTPRKATQLGGGQVHVLHADCQVAAGWRAEIEQPRGFAASEPDEYLGIRIGGIHAIRNRPRLTMG